LKVPRSGTFKNFSVPFKFKYKTQKAVAQAQLAPQLFIFVFKFKGYGEIFESAAKRHFQKFRYLS